MVFFICLGQNTEAEHVHKPDTIDVSNIRLSENIRKAVSWKTINPGFTDFTMSGMSLPDFVSKKVPPSLVEKPVYLKFILKNTAPRNITIYFFPGFHFRDITLYRADDAGSGMVRLEHYADESPGFKKIIVPPGSVSVYVAQLAFIKTTVNILNPELVRDYYLQPYITSLQSSGKDINIITYVFSGILLMMIFYSAAVFVLNKNIEFLYYSGYALCMSVMFFLKSYFYKAPFQLNHFFEAYLDFVFQSVGTFIYVSFLRKFIEAKRNFPFLYKMFLVEQVIIIASISMFSYLYFFTDQFVTQNWVENVTKYLWSLSAIVFVVYAIVVKNKLLYYLAAGHFFLLCCGLISLYLINSPTLFGPDVQSFANNSLLYYEIGLGIELIFFLIALAFKNKNDIVVRTKEGERLKLRSERQEFEKQLAVLSAKQDERNRISADMHDELGSGVTAIRLMSEIVKAKMKENTLPEINRISNSANDLINKMNTIIWTMKSENDSLESLVTYIRTYALEFFENTPISCVVNIPEFLPNVELSGEKRRNIFLSVKETLNNVLKHSKAGKVVIAFSIGEHITITVVDDGVGIDKQKLRKFGNGLTNIKKRIESIQGEYHIENNNRNGTKSTLTLDLR